MRCGFYFYSYAVEVYPVLRLQVFRMRVEVLAETEKRYQVRYMDCHENGKDRPGSEHWVTKRKVKLDEPAPEAQDEPREIRKPYKDD